MRVIKTCVRVVVASKATAELHCIMCHNLIDIARVNQAITDIRCVVIVVIVVVAVHVVVLAAVTVTFVVAAAAAAATVAARAFKCGQPVFHFHFFLCARCHSTLAADTN